jgi:hypothetical protein
VEAFSKQNMRRPDWPKTIWQQRDVFAAWTANVPEDSCRAHRMPILGRSGAYLVAVVMAFH